jgi:hypothetical protein
MNRYKLLLGVLALAAVTLVGCNQPVGLPNNDVHAATTTAYCYLVDPDSGKWSGHLDLYSGYMSIDSCIDSFSPTIRRGYYEYQNRPYPRQIGFAVFAVPQFDSHGNIPTCTLYYYQRAHSGSPDLEVRWPAIYLANAPKESLYWYSWNSNVIIATDSTHGTNGLCKVALTSEGCGKIVDIGTSGGNLYTGWVYPDSVDGIYTEVYGATSNYPPYIKVVY